MQTDSNTASQSIAPSSAPSAAPPHHRLTAVPLRQVTLDDPFWSPKLKLWRDVTLSDCFTKFESDHGGAIGNFDLVRDHQTGRHAGPPWYDGLICGMIRGAADFLAQQRSPSLEARIDGYIARIVAAQAEDPDGYINTWTQSMLPQTQRWGMNGGDDRYQHDVYNAGMMIEAGVHYYRATGRPALLKAATRMADLMCKVIGPSPRANVVPGHSGPEEALVALYRLYRDDPEARRTASFSGDARRYLKLAQFFIDARGHHEGRTGKDKSFEEYGQDHAPLAQQASLEGHAVRAALFCTGIAAAAYDDGRPEYLAAALRLWDSLVRHKMYITGAAGAVAADEKLGADYFLPNDGYMETCAAVGVGFFAHNMNLLFADAGYVDVLEQALYNAVPGGVSLSGDHYFYQNPLTGEGLRRWGWHDCPCCPPMFAKMMGALPGCLYAQEPGAVYVNLFAGSHASLSVEGVPVKLKQTTHYPWSGDVTITLDPERPAEFDLYVRIPGWAEGPASPNALYTPVGLPEEGAAHVTVNGEPIGKLDKVRGYARLRRRWKAGDVVELKLDMPVRQVKAHPSVLEDQGRVALTRGPIIYCVESVDVPEGPRHLVVPPDARLKAEYRPELLGGVAILRGKVRARSREAGRLRTEPAQLTAIPFYASANREPCSMRVWLAADPTKAVPATLTTRGRVTASHCWQGDSTAAGTTGSRPQAPATPASSDSPGGTTRPPRSGFR